MTMQTCHLEGGGKWKFHVGDCGLLWETDKLDRNKTDEY